MGEATVLRCALIFTENAAEYCMSLYMSTIEGSELKAANRLVERTNSPAHSQLAQQWQMLWNMSYIVSSADVLEILKGGRVRSLL